MIGFEELVAECGETFDREIAEQTLAEVPGAPEFVGRGGAGWLLELLEEREHGYIN